MERYSSKKSNSPTKKSSIFKKYKFLKEKIHQTEKNIKVLERQKINKPSYEVKDINEQIYQHKQYLKKLNRDYSKVIRRFAKIAATFGVVLTIATSSYGTYKSNADFNENFIGAYNIIELDNKQISTNIEDNSDLLYEQLKSDIEAYTKLSQKEKLTRPEKEHMEKLKERINANPEGITRLSLDILKQKIANSLDIDDYSRIKISDKSTQIRADMYHPESGSKTDISISVDGKNIASLEEFRSLSTGELMTSSDSIPKDVLKVINKVVNAQKDPQDTKKATKALKSSINLDEKEISFENEATNDLNEER